MHERELDITSLKFSRVKSTDVGCSRAEGRLHEERRHLNDRARAHRAAQFMPFAALTGYYELARRQEHIIQPRHELTDEEAYDLSCTISQITRGEMARVTFYEDGSYHTITGMVSLLDVACRRLRVIKTTIRFDDILSIERINSTGEGVH